MQSLYRILRDVRSDEARTMDPRLIDILSATQWLIGYDRPYSVISGYRTQRTNDLLRSRQGGVARKKHIGAGGVGVYTRSNFVHLDSGPVRSWGS